MNINIRSIQPFRSINESSLQKIKESFEILNYPIGYPICKTDLIPNKVLIIISGEARLLHKSNSKTTTISKLRADSFIGLPSLLSAKGCESISASSEVTVLSLPDNLILDLYNNEEDFKF